ncbi:MAG: regulatory protein GemA [Rhodocyclaceae bacterium]|nr:regulatory protein GemA [Rhodocyclaceae bacterium]
MPFDLAGARRAIFAECRAQGIDEETRRQIIREVGRVASGSTKDMGADAARRVLDHLKQKSAPAGRRGGGEWDWIDTAADGKRPLLRKLAALAGPQGAGIEKGKQVRYIEGIARQMAGGDVVKPLAMCSERELWQIVAALEVAARRRRAAAERAPVNRGPGYRAPKTPRTWV